MTRFVAAIDLDRCLLNSANEVSERNRNALARAASAGAAVILASGRMLPAMRSIVSEIPNVVALVALNGALVVETASGAVLLERTLSNAEVGTLLNWSKQQECSVMLCCGDTVHVAAIDGIVEEYAARTRMPVSVQNDLPNAIPTDVHKALVYRRYPLRTDELALQVALRDDQIAADLTLYRSDHGYVEVSPAGTSKEQGLAIAMEAVGLMGLPLMAIGDGENDIGMLRLADRGYAVENACGEAKDVAGVIVADCDSDGVAEAVADFIGYVNSAERLRSGS